MARNNYHILAPHVAETRQPEARHAEKLPSPQPANTSATESSSTGGTGHPSITQVFFDFELDAQPYPLDELNLEPPVRSQAPSTGRMVLTVLISKDGQIIWSHIESSDFTEDDNRYLVETFTHARFAPGMIAGKAVDAIIRIEIDRNGY